MDERTTSRTYGQTEKLYATIPSHAGHKNPNVNAGHTNPNVKKIENNSESTKIMYKTVYFCSFFLANYYETLHLVK